MAKIVYTRCRFINLSSRALRYRTMKPHSNPVLFASDAFHSVVLWLRSMIFGVKLYYYY